MSGRRSLSHLRVRAVSLLVAVAALSTAAAAPRPGRRTPDARARLASAIERATRLTLGPEGVVFESPDALGWRDALFGHAVMFTASAREGDPRDVWRARVRVSPSGSLLAMDGPVNLTQSPLGDDGPLRIESGTPRRSRRVAFVTRAFGQVQSAALLDPTSPSTRTVTLRQGITNLLGTLSWRGVERWDLRLDRPVRDLSVSFERGTLVARADGATWRADPTRSTVTPTEGASLVRQQDVEKPLVHWAVDTVRGLSWVGPAPIAWLEQQVFNARDAVQRRAFRWFGARPDDGSRRADDEGAPQVIEGRAIVTAQREDRDHNWPPPDIEAPIRSLPRERGEGVWVDASPPWLRRQDGAPPAFYRTWLRLDAERPYTRIVLLAMDLRQIEVGMQAGVEDPVPLVGPRGDGRIPRDPRVLSRLVGAFNGAFKTEHGEYGMVVDRRVLLPPRARAATVATLDDGRVAMGTWDAVSTLPPSVISLRQNLDPLVADGVENPARRGLWGFVLGGVESMPTVRSGLCIDPHGAALYVWGEETTGRLLGHAMRLAGCSYGMHLDMNPGHAVFQFLRVEDIARRQWQHQPLASGMRVGGERFLYYSPKDFFYLTLRPLRPRALDGDAWTPAPWQPPPRWMPAIFRTQVGAIALTSVSLDRVSLRLRAGRQEPVAREIIGRYDTLALPVGAEVLGALELGVARGPTLPRGLVVEGHALLSFAPTPGTARFELGDAGPAIVAAQSPVGELRDAVQGTLLVERSAAVASNDLGAETRMALALTRDRRLLVAEGTTNLATLSSSLIAAGAETAILVDAGPLTAHAHWGDGVLDAYPSTTLFVLSGEAPPAVARLEPILAGARSGDAAVATRPRAR